jgi:hypothetical protein
MCRCLDEFAREQGLLLSSDFAYPADNGGGSRGRGGGGGGGSHGGARDLGVAPSNIMRGGNRSYAGGDNKRQRAGQYDDEDEDDNEQPAYHDNDTLASMPASELMAKLRQDRQDFLRKVSSRHSDRIHR